jgi:hypothetical protein
MTTMTDSDKREAFTLRRWSQRKLAAAREAQQADPPAAPVAAKPEDAKPAPSQPATAPAEAAPQLPPIDSLTIDSDFTPFLRPDVDETLRRGALRKLFSDPRFNVMDGLDVYIDDYSKPDPIAPEIVAQLAHARYIFDPPKTRVNAEGHVEDVPPEVALEAGAPPADAAVEPPATSCAQPSAAEADAPVGPGQSEGPQSR